MKIYNDFFDSDCLKYIEEQIERSKNTASLRTSYPSYNWPNYIIQDSTPVIIYDMYDADILLNRLEEVMEIKNPVTFMIYYWPVGSYIPWHNDAHATWTATLYCNKIWDMDWGGLFLYKEEDKILAEVPEWNKLIIQTDKAWHSTTPITKPYLHQPHPELRTTIQMFEG